MAQRDMETLRFPGDEITYRVRDNRIGDMDDLETSDKSSIIAAINEEHGDKESVKARLGEAEDDITDLENAVDGKASSAEVEAIRQRVDTAESDIEDLERGKADTEHTHEIDDVTGLADALALKASVNALESLTAQVTQDGEAIAALQSGKADAVHAHDIEDVNGLQDALDGKADEATTEDHGTRIEALEADVEALGSGKAEKEHRHEQGDVIGLVDALEGKAAAADVAGLTGRVTTNEGAIAALQTSKAEKIHNHTMSNVEGLTAALEAKASTSSVSTLAGRVTQTESDIAELEGEIARVEGEIPKTLAELEGDANHRTVTDAEKALWNAGCGLKPYTSLEKIKPYLYDAGYTDLDYASAREWFETHEAAPAGACSAIRNGRFYGRTFDWTYDRGAEVVVHTAASGARYASIGIAGGVPGLTEDEMDEIGDDIMRVLPFFTRDGVNEYGLTVSTLVVPGEGHTTVSVPAVEQRCSINGIMLTRYILDHFKTAAEACAYVRDYVSVWFAASLHEMDYEQHYMIADAEKTYILEFVNDAAVGIDITDTPYATNFLRSGITLNADGGVYTPATLGQGSPTANNHITAHGAGLERFNAIVAAYASTGTAEGMRALLDELKYTRAYATSEDPSDPYWYTEFVGDDLHCDSATSAFSDAVTAAGTAYLNRSRDDAVPTWQTVHSVVYDMSAHTMSVIVQEDGTEITFALGALDERMAVVEDDVSLLKMTKVNKTTTINGHELSEDITISADDVGAYTSQEGAALAGRVSTLEAKYNTINVTCVTQDGVTVTGQTVYLHNGDSIDAPVEQSKAYNGQPVTFEVPINYAFFVNVSDTLDGHFNPTTASGITDTDKSVTLTYADVENITTFTDLQAVIPMSENSPSLQSALIGVEIADTWTAEDGTVYQDPMVVVSLEYIEDENGTEHWGAYIQRKWASRYAIQYSQKQNEVATEANALANTYYYGLNGEEGTTANLTKLELNTGAAIPYSSYDKIYHTGINDTSKYIVFNGYNRWSHSAYRQYLNSSAAINRWWTAQHPYDMAPDALASRRGYMAGCTSSLLAAAKQSKVSCYLNSVTDGSIIEKTVDTFFLPSGTQMYGSVNANEGVYWEYWKRKTGLSSPANSENVGRITYAVESHTLAQYCRLRSAGRSSSYYAWYVITSGHLGNGVANGSFRAAPACAIW